MKLIFTTTEHRDGFITLARSMGFHGTLKTRLNGFWPRYEITVAVDGKEKKRLLSAWIEKSLVRN